MKRAISTLLATLAAALVASSAVAQYDYRDPGFRPVDDEPIRTSARVGVDVEQDTWDAYPGALTPSIDNLDPLLCLNGVCRAPTFLYVGKDASTSSWPARYGATLNIAQAGTDPTVGVRTPWATTDRGVRFNGGKVYTDPAQFTALGTNDAVWEVLFRHANNGTFQAIVSSFSQVSGVGFSIYVDSLNVLHANLDGAVSIPVVDGPTLVPGAWYHVFVVFDRSGSGVVYTNGAAGTPASIASVSGENITGGPLNIGASTTLSIANGIEVAYAAGWFGANWLDTHAQPATALDRMMRLASARPRYARGAYNPTTVTRTTPGYMSVCASGVTSLFLMGANYPRVNRYCSWPFGGYLVEGSSQNILIQSEDFATSWNVSATGIATNAAIAPNLAQTADRITADNGVNNFHTRYQSASYTAGTVYTCSVFVKADTATWGWFGADANGQQRNTFNAATGTLGTAVNGSAAVRVSSWGDGWYRYEQTFTAGSTASHPFSVGIAQNSTTLSYTGAGEALYVWGAQCEAWGHATSYYATTTATATRGADALVFPSASNISAASGSIRCLGRRPNFDALADGVLVNVHNGSTNGLVGLIMGNSLDQPRFDTWSGGVQQSQVAGTSDVADGSLHWLAGSWKTDSAKLFVDGTGQGTPDTSGSSPPSFTSISLGQYLGTAHLYGEIFRCRATERLEVTQ